jgi:hypothetical protein
VALLYLLKICLHYHQHTMSRQMAEDHSRLVNTM